MADARAVLAARPPDLRDRRGDRHLLVWGELGEWLLVDLELRDFLERFDGRRSLQEVIAVHASATGQRADAVAAVAAPIVAQLSAQGILAPRGAPLRPVPAEPLRIANVTLNVTNTCNLRCRWCYTRHHDSDEASIDLLMDRFAEAGELFAPTCSFIILGGEPLARPARLLRALDRAAEAFTPPTLVSTNGTLITPELAGELTARAVEVQVSLDGPTATRHDAVRGAGAFDRACAGIAHLRAAGVSTLISMVYTRDSLDDLEPYLDLARELGVAEARFFPMRQIGAGQESRALAPDQAATLRALLAILDRRPELRPLLRRDYFSIQHAVCRFAAHRSGCGVGRRVVCVDADGTVYPCPNQVEPHQALGDLREKSLREIFLEGARARALRERFVIERYSECRICALRRWCAGDCRGEVLACTGDPHAASPHCAELREVFLDLLWLVAEGDPRLGAAGAGAADEVY